MRKIRASGSNWWTRLVLLVLLLFIAATIYGCDRYASPNEELSLIIHLNSGTVEPRIVVVENVQSYYFATVGKAPFELVIWLKDGTRMSYLTGMTPGCLVSFKESRKIKEEIK